MLLHRLIMVASGRATETPGKRCMLGMQSYVHAAAVSCSWFILVPNELAQQLVEEQRLTESVKADMKCLVQPTTLCTTWVYAYHEAQIVTGHSGYDQTLTRCNKTIELALSPLLPSYNFNSPRSFSRSSSRLSFCSTR